MIYRLPNRCFLLVFFFLALCGCKGVHSLLGTLSPYERYEKSLAKAGLMNTVLYTSWKEAGEQAFHDSLEVSLPFAEASYLQASKPSAHAYRFYVEDGQVLTVTLTSKSKASTKIFLDLFEWKGGKWKQRTYADTAATISEEFDDRTYCLLRIQPELLANVYFSLQIHLVPALVNPVKGASNQSIKSLYGVDRDGGARKHEGIDIFAPKGTLVQAPAAGIVSRVTETKLGGKVVWMLDSKRGHSYYFAHLDSQLVSVGQVLKQGDVIGLVGNTGNAKYTPPHLHFGLYKKGSKDPIAYVRTIERLVEESVVDTSLSPVVLRVQKTGTELHVGPNQKSRTRDKLRKDTYLQLLGVSGAWYKVQLANGEKGYVTTKSAAKAEPGSTRSLETITDLIESPQGAAVPVQSLQKGEKVTWLAEAEGFDYVRTGSEREGWMRKP